MIDSATLKAWIGPVAGTDRYLRPFVARGPLAERGAAIVGLNPATAIRPSDIAPDSYIKLLLDLSLFTRFYEGLRVAAGKRRTSQTRTGLNGIADWLEKRGWSSIVDTNVSPYPTARGEELKAVPASAQSRHIFRQMLEILQPKLVVLHGQDALEEFTLYLAPHLTESQHATFSATVENSPFLGTHSWRPGVECEVFVCPHLRFFGRAGGVRFAPLLTAMRDRGHVS